MSRPHHAAEGRQIMHFTHLSNLSMVIEEGALFADSCVGDRLRVEVGNRRIKAYRRVYRVACGLGGYPGDYVPFYFESQSLTLASIASGCVPRYQEGQDPLVYLVGTIGEVVRAGLPWVFSNGNCGARGTAYFNDLTLLSEPARAKLDQAEFLVHERMPWSLIRELVTRTEATAAMVRRLLSAKGQTLQVVVRPDWYYDGERFR